MIEDQHDASTEAFLRDELDQWQMVRYRMDDEGMEYCFRHYSSFSEIKDEEFHTLRLKLIELMEQMEQFVANKIEEIDNQISNLDEQ
jgi:hypothetical protein